MEHTIQHHESGGEGAFFIEEQGRRLAELTYSRTNPLLVSVDHVEVDHALRGQGMARLLLDEVVRWARASGTKIIPLCSYAAAQFDRDPSIRDVRA